MWDFFIRKDRFAYLVMAALIGFGLYSLAAIPKESAPEVQIPVGIVTTILPGAAATDVENLITNEIERTLDGSLSDVRRITSTSRESVSTIVVEFTASADLNSSLRSLRDEVDRVAPELPASAERPVVTEVDFVDQPIFSFAVAGDRSDVEFIAIAERIEDTIRNITGVSRVELSGVREREVHILVDQTALTRTGLSLTDITQGLQAANTSVPIGEIVTDGVAFNVVFAGDIKDSNEIPSIPIATRNGQPIYVRDVARVVDGVSVASTFARLSVAPEPAQRSIGFDVFKQRDANIIDLTRTISAAMEELTASNGELADLTFYTIQDQGQLIGDDLQQLTISGLQTATLVMVLLIITIGWREGLIAGLAIPLSFTIGFIGLFLSGNTINFISLFALILGIGILVDSSIVMVEGINRRMKADLNVDKVEAAIATIRAFAKPVIAGTLTTVAMFSGLFIVSGVTGQFIASIPFTLIFILLASLLVAIGFIPLIAATFLRRRSNTRIEQAQVAYAQRLEKWYTKRLQAILASRKKKVLFVSSLLVAFVSSFLLIPLGLVQVIFFGSGDADNLFIEVALPVGSIKETTDRRLREVEEILYQVPEIEAFRTTIGASSAFLGGGTSGGNIANITVALQEDRLRASTEISAELDAQLSLLDDLDITISQPDAGPPTGAPIRVDVIGTDLQAMSDTARDIAEVLRGIEHSTNVRDGADAGNSEFVFSLETDRAAVVGLDARTISGALRTAVVGTEATTLRSLTDEIPITVRLDLSGGAEPDIDRLNHTDIDTLQNLTLTTPQGQIVLLDSLLTAQLQEARSVIEHRDRQRVIAVTADVTPAGNVRAINQELLERIDDLDIPDGITTRLGGETEESDQAFAEIFLALIVGIVLMIGVLVLQFNSFRYPLYVLSIVPFSLIGILYGLAIVGSPLSFPSMMGFIALTGIVVNNSILLIDMINQQRRSEPHRPVREVVIEASASRLRPIVLTTFTTVLGISPLLFSDPIWVPLATAIMFGLSFSVIITLILIPIIYDKFPGTVRR